MNHMFEDYFAVLPHEDMHGRILFESVREGMSPFRPETISASLEFDIDVNRYWLFVEVVFKDGYRLAHGEHMEASLMYSDPDVEIFRVSKLMFNAFRNREDYHAFVPKTVELGEN